ncbi:P-loop containing nucleoside triphosphate hydrolase protein, partial [Blyttiomyces helicus]
DPEAIKTWIYPTNCSARDYQFNITQKALFSNTLVALPTGLGKTLIAAVVMFNYFRWFPEGKIVFMAPTKPLVAQQIEACYKITGIPQAATVELTGQTTPEMRRLSWLTRRVFFLTPQVMQNDLNRGTCPHSQVVLVVVDEAHRGTGNHAYCEVVRELRQQNEHFRILALTATPGAELKTVQAVVQNLLISRIEIRTETSPDIKPYLHQRELETIKIAKSEIIQVVENAFSKIMGIFLGRLCRERAFYNNDAPTVTSFQLMQARDRWRNENKNIDKFKAASIEGAFGVAMSLASPLQLLQKYGIRTFYAALTRYIEEGRKEGSRISQARAELLKSSELAELVSTVEAHMLQPDFVSHPKVDHLTAIVIQHFTDHEEEMRRQRREGSTVESRETRAMIFTQFRESVEEIVSMLDMHKPMVRAMSFVGQAGTKGGGKGFTQKEQLQVNKR